MTDSTTIEGGERPPGQRGVIAIPLRKRFP